MSEKKKLLVADDDDQFRELLYLFLRKKGYAVRTAADGGEALEMAYADKPDLLLLDLMMPVKDGFQVASELTAKLGTDAPKILVITGRNLLEEDVALLLAGVAGSMHKPIKLDDLEVLVAKTLAESPGESPFDAIQGDEAPEGDSG